MVGVRWTGRYGAYPLLSPSGAWSPPLAVEAHWIDAARASVRWTERSDADRVCLSVVAADGSGGAPLCLPAAPGMMRAEVEAERSAYLLIEEWRGSTRYGIAGPFRLGAIPGLRRVHLPLVARP
jgi:hypothetical protein